MEQLGSSLMEHQVPSPMVAWLKAEWQTMVSIDADQAPPPQKNYHPHRMKNIVVLSFSL